MANPFQVTKPVAPGEVIDRDAESGRLLELAWEGNNARVVGPRRYGKTSVLRRVQDRLADQGWLDVYVDLLGIVTADDLTARIERAYTLRLTGRLAQWWAGVRRQLKPSASVGGGPVPGSLSLDLSGPARDALIDRLDLPLKVHEKTGDRVHVVFDEFQELDRTAQKHLDHVLRSVIQHHGDAASYVFAGSELHMMEMLFSDPQRAFYGQSHKVALKPLGDDVLGDYIVSRFEATGKSVSPDALFALLSLVAGHPQRAMVAAHALWDATDRLADIEEWESARVAVMDAVEDELRALWMASERPQREVLVRIAQGLPAFSRSSGGTRGGSVAKALDSLGARGAIAEDDAGGRYVVDTLFAEWIRTQR